MQNIKNLVILFLIGMAAAVPGCTDNAAAPAAVTPTQTVTIPPANVNPSGKSVTLTVTARDMQFDQKTLTVPAGSNVTIVFTNRDSVPHNISIYTNSAATDTVYRGEIVSNSTVNYQFMAPVKPGTYFFRCDVHPTVMTGSFIVN
jgi:plastocyanin